MKRNGRGVAARRQSAQNADSLIGRRSFEGERRRARTQRARSRPRRRRSRRRSQSCASILVETWDALASHWPELLPLEPDELTADLDADADHGAFERNVRADA